MDIEADMKTLLAGKMLNSIGKVLQLSMYKKTYIVGKSCSVAVRG